MYIYLYIYYIYVDVYIYIYIYAYCRYIYAICIKRTNKTSIYLYTHVYICYIYPPPRFARRCDQVFNLFSPTLYLLLMIGGSFHCDQLHGRGILPLETPLQTSLLRYLIAKIRYVALWIQCIIHVNLNICSTSTVSFTFYFPAKASYIYIYMFLQKTSHNVKARVIQTWVTIRIVWPGPQTSPLGIMYSESCFHWNLKNPYCDCWNTIGV